MNKTSGNKVISSILDMMLESEHISEEFKHFIERCLDDYLYDGKISHALKILIEYDSHIVDLEQLKDSLKSFGGLNDERKKKV